MIRKLVTLFLLVCSVWVSATSAAGQKQSPPSPEPPKPFKFPEFSSKILANGLQVVVIEHHEQPTVSLEVLVKSGAEQDPAALPGVASLAAALLDEGTKTRSALQIAETIESVGGQIGTGSSWHESSASVSVLKNSVDVAFDVLADVVINPTFKDDEIERQTQQLLSGLQIQYSDPSYLATAASQRVIFGEHPYGHPSEGTPDSIRRIKRDDLVKFHQAVYHPNNAILAVVGDISLTDALAKAEKYFGSWPRGEVKATALSSSAPTQGRKVIIIDKSDAVQTEIRLGKVGVARSDPDYVKLQVLNAVLASASGSRLWDVLRRQRGLTYGVSSSIEALRERGSLTISTFTRTEKTAETLNLIISELGRIANEKVTDLELTRAKSYLAGGFQRRLETPDSIASVVLGALVYGLDYQYLNAYRDKILAVTANDIQEVARKYHQTSDLTIVLAGNAAGFEKDIASLGQVEKINYREIDLASADLKRAKPAVAAATGESVARARTLLAEAAKAIGGLDALRAVKDLTLKGAASLSTPFGEFSGEQQVVLLLPDKQRLDFKFEQFTVSQAYDGKTGWASTPAGLQDAPPEMLKEFRAGLKRSLFSLYQSEGKEGVTLSHVGTEQLDGKPVEVVQYSDAEDTFKLYFDQQSRLLVKLAFRSPDPFSGAVVDTEELYYDYKDFSGLKYASRMTIIQAGKKFAEMTTNELKINAGVDESVFKKP
jgi:zinc protease